MKVFMFLAEQAASTEGATFSVSRGGLRGFNLTSEEPELVVLNVVVYVASDVGDSGSFDQELRVLDADGGELAKHAGKLNIVHAHHGSAVLVRQIPVTLKPGESYVTVYRVNGMTLAECAFNARHIKKPKKG